VAIPSGKIVAPGNIVRRASLASYLHERNLDRVFRSRPLQLVK